MAEPTVPYPLFPPLGLLNDHAHVEQPINLEVRRRLELVPEHLNALKAWQTGMGFLMKQSRRSGFQDRHYKMLCPIIESMMHWSWSIRGIALADWDSADARAFIEFIMRPPIAWVTTPGCSRYSKKTRGNFANKPLDSLWRPIIRQTLSGDDPGLSSKHHRNWFLTHGREYFAFTDSLLTDAGIGTGNPFRDLSPKDFEARTENRRTILTSEQLSDLMEITESLANYSEKLEPFLFIVAAAVHSDIPMRALTATQTIKPTFSYFKPRDFQVSDPVQSQPKTEFASSYLASRLAFAKGPGFFESPLYLGRRFHLSAPFQPYFQRYAQFRHQHDPLLSAHSYLLPLMHGIDAYGYGSLIEKFSEFTASILQDLRARPASARMHWKGSDKLDPSASLTFAELRESAKRAGLIPKGFVSQDVGANDNVWPDIGIRQDISKSHWFQTH
ncbi:hypothetical protein [Pseudomonas syringae]|uniref:hypothetical protein n=1 Tax=Pseudomonas syringae TaxID=317 RepID=UPI000ACD9891|nr:hypothetical protein [Pseudomonas syringae]NYS41489.1 hypothetical protein [Pseudomonas syringae pv. actinidiae]